MTQFNTRANFATFVLGAFAVVATYPMMQDNKTDDSAQRIEKLEKRVDQLEKIVFSNSKLSLVQAQRRLSEASQRLQHSRQLMAKGYINDLQLQQDEFDVQQAQQELRLARSESQQNQLAVEMDLLQAKQNFVEAQNRLEQTERLFSKGYASQFQVRQDRTALEIAQRQFKNAEIKFEAVKELEAIKKNDETENAEEKK